MSESLPAKKNPSPRERIAELEKDNAKLRLQVEYLNRQHSKLAADAAALNQEIHNVIGELGRVVQERNRIEAELKESKDYYQGLFEGSPTAYWLQDWSAIKRYVDQCRDDGVEDIEQYFENRPEEVARLRKLVKIIRVNEAAVQLYKAECKADLQQGLDRLKPETPDRDFFKQLVTFANGGTLYESETTNLNMKGEVIHIAIRKGVVPGFEQSLSRVMAALKDVTERKQAEQKLRASEARFRAVFEAARDSIFIKDTRGKYRSVNPAMERLLNLSAWDLIGKTDGEVFSSEAGRLARQIDQRVLSGEVVDTELVRVVTGIRRTFHMVEVPMRGSDEEVIGLCGIARDITERKRTSEALRRNEERYRAIVEDQTELIFRCLPNGTITFVNKAFCDYFNQTRAQLLQTNWYDFVFPADHERVGDRLASLNRGFPMATHEIRALAPKGDIRWHRWTHRAIFAPIGAPLEYQSVGHDITDRKRADEQLQASLREKEILLREIHHRVKNNLQLISGLLDLSTIHSQSMDARALLEDARGRIHSMALIHTQLYNSNRFDAIDMEQHIRELVLYLTQTYSIEHRHIAIQVDRSDVRLTVSQAIPCALAINELISNAFKHAFPGRTSGAIRVTMRQDQNHTIQIRVQDDGVGIPMDIDFDKPRNLGLQLVVNLVRRQLKGKLIVSRNAGTAVTMIFEPGSN